MLFRHKRERRNLLVNLINTFNDSKLTVEEGILSLFICQLKSENLLSENWQENPQTEIEKKLNIWFGEVLTQTKRSKKDIILTFKNFFIPNRDDDIIGAFYQSIQTIGQRSEYGSFYTPRTILTKIKVATTKSIYDPCCGSGNILLNVLSKEHDQSLIFASDIDKIALRICEVNLVLFFHNPNCTATIFEKNLFENTFNERKSSVDIKKQKYDFIVTNPPWGAKFSKQEKNELLKNFPELKTTESFSICLYNALSLLKKMESYIFSYQNHF